MKDEVIIETSHGNIKVYNLSTTWLQPMTLRQGYMLCYEDDVMERGIIYRSIDKKILIEKQNILHKELNKNSKLIKL